MNLLKNSRIASQPFKTAKLAAFSGVVLLIGATTAGFVVDSRTAHADTAPVEASDTAPALVTPRTEDSTDTSLALVLAVVGTLAVGTVLAGWQALNGVALADDAANW